MSQRQCLISCTSRTTREHNYSRSYLCISRPEQSSQASQTMNTDTMDMRLEDLLQTVQEQESDQKQLWHAAFGQETSGILPSIDALSRARSSLPPALPEQGLGLPWSRKHILEDIVPAFNRGSTSPNYYGFVTGGVTPAALFADNVVSAYDQNVQVHLPNHSVVTDVEFHTLGLLADLLGFDRGSWQNGTFTTGATASNVLGLACGREFVLQVAAKRKGTSISSTGEYGLFEVLQSAGLSGIQVLSTLPHSSLGKAAAVLGLGRASVKNVAADGDHLRFDMTRLERELARSNQANIIVVSCGEVNTGHFATNGLDELRQLRSLCDQYGAWLHVDGAFGIFARILNNDPEFALLKKGCEGLELADSIGGDGHKFLNVPYDCGFFLCRHPRIASDVFQNANAAYLNADAASSSVVPSPLNIGLENSRRFRALPVYASLLAYGREGYRDMLQKQIRLARRIAGWLFDHPKYLPLPETKGSKPELLERTFMVVLFRACDEALNMQLGDKINATSKIFVSGTSWDGQPASRIAISNWRVDEDRDFDIVREVLESVCSGGEH